jgi:hypothetical protein
MIPVPNSATVDGSGTAFTVAKKPVESKWKSPLPIPTAKSIVPPKANVTDGDDSEAVFPPPFKLMNAALSMVLLISTCTSTLVGWLSAPLKIAEYA